MTQIPRKPDNYIQAAADFFDELIPVATDDELFAAGYLRGHFDLAVGTLEVAGNHFDQADVNHQIEQTLNKAIAEGELNEQDQQLVKTLWWQISRLG